MPQNSILTRDRILQAGLILTSSAGLNGVTLGVLAERVGMSKSGLFAHFRSKEDVQMEILAYAVKIAESSVVEPSMRAEPGLPRLRSLAANWFGWAERAGLPGGCPIAAGLFEFDGVQGVVRDKILEMESRYREKLIEFTTEAVECGHLRPDLDVEQFVWEFSGIYLSHHTARHFFQAEDADRRAARAFESLVERSLTIEPPGKRKSSKNRASNK